MDYVGAQSQFRCVSAILAFFVTCSHVRIFSSTRPLSMSDHTCLWCPKNSIKYLAVSQRTKKRYILRRVEKLKHTHCGLEQSNCGLLGHPSINFVLSAFGCLVDGELAIRAVRNHSLTRLQLELGAIKLDRENVRFERHKVGNTADFGIGVRI
jgi:hypothetical protein